MLKFSIKVTVFLVLVFALVLGSGKLFLNKSNIQSFNNKTYSGIKESNINIEIAFFGTSHAYCSYDPRVFENEFKTMAYNYGGAIQNLVVTKPVIEHVLSEQQLKLAVVDIFSGALRELPFSERVSNFQLQTIDYLPLSIKKIQLFGKIYNYENIVDILPTFREHAIWKDRFFQQKYYLKTERDYYNGYNSLLYFDKKSWLSSTKNRKPIKFNERDSTYHLSLGQKEMIDTTIDLFKTKNIPLVFVSAPIHKKNISNKYYNFQQVVKEYLIEKNTPFIDYNDLWDEIGLHLYDFKDKGHLNPSGALKISQHLANYIKNNYDIEGKSAPDLSKNRYALLENPKKNGAAFYKKINNVKAQKETGVEEVILYKDRYGRLEILLVGDYLKDISIKVGYDVPPSKKRQLAKDIQKQIKKGRYTLKEKIDNLKSEGLYNGYQYKGKEFKVFLIDCPLSKVKNLRVNLGSASPKETVINLKELKLD